MKLVPPSRRIALAALIALVLAGTSYAIWRGQASDPRFTAAAVSRGDITRAVVATGTVNPVVTVQVGTYVSGVIQSMFCDYNTHVTAGQLCAKIDPRPYQVIVDQSEANLASAIAQEQKDKASLALARIVYARDLGLRKKGIVAQETVDNDKSTLDQAVAQVDLDAATIQQRKAALDAAKVNLDYTNIVSPVDGVVVSRNVDVGQTVAASFQTPTLFLIAQDLTKMQVDTNVSESDIGGVKDRQKASFTVEAFPGKTFEAQVTQVRQAPITVQNVVTYDVVLGVNNPELQLLPGMTANARIITDERKDVLRVPVAALRFTPQGRKGGGEGKRGNAEDAVWVLRDSRPERVAVTAGLSDGSFTEITSGNLQPQDQVITGEIAGEEAKPQTPRRSSLRF